MVQFRHGDSTRENTDQGGRFPVTAYKNASIEKPLTWHHRCVWLRPRLQKFSVLMMADSLGDHRCPVTGIGGAGAGAGNRDMNNTRYTRYLRCIPEYAEQLRRAA